MISALLTRRDLVVAVVDTWGGSPGGRLGDVRALKDGLVRRIREGDCSGRDRSTGRVGGKYGGDREKDRVGQRAEETVVGKVQDCLERVKVMRVFDLEGVMEAVGEVREGLEGGSPPDGGTGAGGEEGRDETDYLNTEARGEVGDSQDETDDDGEGQMDVDTGSSSGVGGRGLTGGVLHEESAARMEDGRSGPKVGMIVIDNITNVTSAMMNSFGQSEGLFSMFSPSAMCPLRIHVGGEFFLSTYIAFEPFRRRCDSLLMEFNVIGLAVLHTLLHSLTLLTRHHHLVTIILNGVVPVQATSRYYANARHRDDVVVTPVFASTNVRPALGKGFLGAVDVHLLLGKVPRTKRDAESAYAGEDEDGGDGDGDGEVDDEKGERGHDGGRGRRRKAKTWEEVGICEVLTDREGDRAGRWAPFNIVSSPACG